MIMVATNTPQPEVTRYVAIIQSMVAFGDITGPAVGGILADWVGYRGSMLVSFMVVAMSVLFVYLLVEERHKAVVNAQPTSLWQDFQLALKRPILVTALCSDMTYAFIMMASQPILILYIQELTHSQVNLFTGPIFALPGLAIVLTNYFWCRLGERYTFQRIILLGLAGAGLFIFLQGVFRNIWWFAASYLMAGLCAAAVSPNTTGLVVTNVETDFQGRAFAIQQSFRRFGSFLAPLLAGSLGSILSLQWVFITVGLLGLATTATIRLQIRTYQHSEVKTPIPVGPQ
jgi:DHA1 family multidrug resistance protein-like MFS transporter